MEQGKGNEPVVVIGAERALAALGLGALAAFLVFGVDDGWLCAVPIAVMAVALAVMVVSDSRRAQNR